MELSKFLPSSFTLFGLNSPPGGGGVDGTIRRAAGQRLLEGCKTVGGSKTGEAKITTVCNLPAKYVIHTVGPVWRWDTHNENQLLASFYKNSLFLASENSLSSIAFPSSSSGSYGFPFEEATRIALLTTHGFLKENQIALHYIE